MTFASVLLYAFEVLAGLAAVGILFVRNVFHAALLLIVCLISLAGVFVFHHAEYIAVTQILVYAGGVLVLIIFGIMLSSRITGKPLAVNNQYVPGGLLIGLILTATLIKLFSQQRFHQAVLQPETGIDNPIQQTGITLMRDYVLPFEVAGMLLLIALIGAAVTASSFYSRKN